MAGVLFVICVPTEIYEKTYKKAKDYHRKSTNSDLEQENTVNFLSDSHEKLTPIKKHESLDTNLHSCFKTKSCDLSKDEQPNLFPSKSFDEKQFKTLNLDNKRDENDITNMALEKILRRILDEQKIKNAVWTKGEPGDYLQVIFPSEAGTFCERILTILNEYGIGQRLNSVVSVIPCSLCYKNQNDCEKLESGEVENNSDAKNEQVKDSAWHTFVTSVRARLTVAQVVESVKADAALTFDFLILLLIATTLSAIALAENNIVYLVSSMLISPMMGPVMAGTFGSVIQDRKLQKIGVLNELIGLGIATAVGFCYGTISTSFTDKYGDNDWPTYEMTSRGEVRTLWVGCLTALLSGAAVALGILGDNISSLVGVAISASLMPPAVNAGLLWGMATAYACAGENSSKSIVRTHFYFDDDVWELAALGGMSMCLTFVNIVCIYFAGILVFKIKEVAPIFSRKHNRRFWKYDIKIARDYNRTLQKDDAKILSKQMGNVNRTKSLFKTNKFLKHINYQDITDHLYQSTEVAREHIVDVGRNQNTWSPSTFAPKRPTVQELKSMYFSLYDNKPKAQKNLAFRFPHSREMSAKNWLSPAGPSYGSISSDPSENLPCIPENVVSPIIVKSLLKPEPVSEKSTRRSKYVKEPTKFVVTPASIDNPN